MKKSLTFAGASALALVVFSPMDALKALFSSNYLPHRFCYLAQPGLVWTNVVADALIGSSYIVIFACLFWVANKLRRVPGIQAFLWIFLGFGAFILACGGTHMMDVVTVWWPVYPLSAAVKVVCVLVSVPTAIYLVRVTPQLAANVRAFVELAGHAQDERNQAVLALVIAQQQADEVRIAAATALAESNNRFRLLVEAVTDYALFFQDLNGNITSWNRGAERLLGYSEAEILGSHFSRLYSPEDVAKGLPDDDLQEALRTGRGESHICIVRAGGERFWANVYRTVTSDEDGQPRDIAVVMRDITARREAEIERSRAEARLHAVVDHAVDGLIAIDERGNMESFNPACERIFGYSAAEVLGRNIRMLMPEPYHSAHDGYLSRYVATGEARIIGTAGREVSGRRKDGSVFPLDLSISAFQLQDGRHFSGIIRDITEQKKAALAFAETNNRFRLLVEGVKAHALFTIDTTGCVTSWNRGAERLLGYQDEQIVGRNFSCFFTPQDIQRGVPETQMGKAREAGMAEDEGWRVCANGELFWANVSKTALLEEGDRSVRGFAILVQDVTERKKIADAMEEARLEKLRLQEGFLSHVSHELRTPLTAIYFFTTNVLDGLFGDLNAEQRDHLALALDNANQLKNMVSDLLDITRVQTHKLTVSAQPANPSRLISEVLNTCRTNAQTKDISLLANFAADLPFVWADPARVRQILINLVDNGIKFTPPGGTITVEAELSTEENGFLRFSVSDTGCGISPENHQVIFERLSQVKNNNEASRGGLGLGLFIAKELVTGHGGKIWVESVHGEGSTFHFTLPIFSLSQWCARVLIAPNLQTGSVTLIAVDLFTLNGAVQRDFIHEIRRALERCIQPGQDVILPSMSTKGREAEEGGDTEEGRTIFIVACTGPDGFAVIESRIKRELQNTINISRFRPIISSTTIPVTPDQPREQQIAEISAGIERSIQAHVLSKERLQ